MGNLNSRMLNWSGGSLEDDKSGDPGFKKKYKLGVYIASGTFATVRQCVRIADGKHFAVKMVEKSGCTRNELSLLRDEIAIYSALKHQHIITLEDVIENGQTVHMVLELCNDKTLSDIRLSSPNSRLKESHCAHIAQIIAQTLKYIHAKKIVHRDLKPENILFNKENVLKITDFGSAFTGANRSKYLNRSFSRMPSFRMDTVIGTPNYVAPEILKGDAYSYRVDLWSLGVILFECLSGFHPFSTRKSRKSIGRLYAAIIAGQYNMGTIWKSMDEDATDLVKKLIIVDPKQRINVDELLLHSFITKHAETNGFGIKTEKQSDIQSVVEDIHMDEKNDNECEQTIKIIKVKSKSPSTGCSNTSGRTQVDKSI